MQILVYLTTLYLSCLADPKAPRIYNVLISSKKNLSPSEALPVYEPVIRTTSLGYFPPLTIYSTLGQPYRIIPQYTLNTYSGYGAGQSSLYNQKISESGPLELNNLKLPENQIQQKITNEQNVQDQGALPNKHFVPQSHPILENYEPQIITQTLRNQQGESGSISFEKINENQDLGMQSRQEGQQAKFSIPRPENFPSLAQETDPKHAIANLRHKSDIPDVPPPPLPVRSKS